MLVAAPRPWAGLAEALWWAARAIRTELWGFRFDYPIEPVPDAAARGSLHYHIYSERLFFDAMEIDVEGVPVHRSRTFGKAYNPAYVAWYGLMRLERALRAADPTGRAAFETQVTWLADHAVRRDDGAVVWPLGFDWIEGTCELKAPWVSAMAQGLAMSALVRGYRLTGDAHLLQLARAACLVFEADVADGGVRMVEGGHVLYEEYPGFPPPRVLDGFLFSLLGLSDVFTETGDTRVFRLFADGVDGLANALPFWNYRDKWSWYGSHGYLCPPQYNQLNCALLSSLARLSGRSSLQDWARRWNPTRLTALDRVEVFLVFLMTKNRSRFTHFGRSL